VAQGEDPAEEKQRDRKAITVKELRDLYLADLKAGLAFGKRARPTKASTIAPTPDAFNATSHAALHVASRRPHQG
jgi:hypothetical protein